MYLYAIFAGQTQAKIRTGSCTEILGMAWSLCHVVRALGRATAHTQMAWPKFSDRLRSAVWWRGGAACSAAPIKVKMQVPSPCMISTPAACCTTSAGARRRGA